MSSPRVRTARSASGLAPGRWVAALVLLAAVGAQSSCGAPKTAGSQSSPTSADPIANVPTQEASTPRARLGRSLPGVLFAEAMARSAALRQQPLDAPADHDAAEDAVAVTLINQLREHAMFRIPADGVLEDGLASDVEHFFRCRRTNRTHEIDPGLLVKLADLARHFEGHTIEIVSAYRHPPHSSRTSRHRHGRAIDLRVQGVPARKVRNYLWSRYTDEVGVGYYKHQQFVHLDHRPEHRATAWTQRRPKSRYIYNPRWSKRVRRMAERKAERAALDSNS